MRNQVARSLCLGPDTQPRYMMAPSAVVTPSCPSDPPTSREDIYDVYDSVERPGACPLYDEEVHPPCDEFGPGADKEQR